MDRMLQINLFARLLLVACPVVAFRFARSRLLKPWQYLGLCAAAGAVANVLWVATMVFTETVWFPSTGEMVSAIARSALYNAAGGLLFGAIGLWRRVASTSRLVIIALAMVAAVDVIHISIDPMLGLPVNEARPMMLIVALIVGSLLYVWNRGTEPRSRPFMDRR